MRNKRHVEDDKMSVTDITDAGFIGLSAKQMANRLLAKEHQGPGDTTEVAAFRCQMKYGVDAEIVLQGRHREIRDMKASRWLSLFRAYWASGLAKADNLYETERARHDDNSALVGLADFVAGAKGRKEK